MIELITIDVPMQEAYVSVREEESHTVDALGIGDNVKGLTVSYISTDATIDCPLMILEDDKGYAYYLEATKSIELVQGYNQL